MRWANNHALGKPAPPHILPRIGPASGSWFSIDGSVDVFAANACRARQPFVQACLDMGENEQAVRFIGKVVDVSKRSEYYLQVGNWKDALEAAVKSKNLDVLERIALRCPVAELQDRAGTARRELVK